MRTLRQYLVVLTMSVLTFSSLTALAESRSVSVNVFVYTEQIIDGFYLITPCPDLGVIVFRRDRWESVWGTTDRNGSLIVEFPSSMPAGTHVAAIIPRSEVWDVEGWAIRRAEPPAGEILSIPLLYPGSYVWLPE